MYIHIYVYEPTNTDGLLYASSGLVTSMCTAVFRKDFLSEAEGIHACGKRFEAATQGAQYP